MKKDYRVADIILNPITPDSIKIELLEKMVSDFAEYPTVCVNHSAINLKLRLEIQKQHDLYSKLQDDYHKLAKQHRDMRELFDDAFVIKSRKKV